MMRSKLGLWPALESLSGGAVKVEWAHKLGTESERAWPFLRPSLTQADTYPCTNRFPCNCRHRVETVRRGPVAVCDCGGCPPIHLAEEDLIVFEADVGKLASAVVTACGWQAHTPSKIALGTWQVGTIGDERWPIIWWMGKKEDRFRDAVDVAANAGAAPFVILTPTRSCLTPQMESLLKREGCVAVALADFISLGNEGVITVIGSATAVVTELRARAATRRNAGEMLRKVHEEIADIKTEHLGLKQAHDRLQSMRMEGLFKFAEKIDAETLRQFLVIMAKGDVAKASRELGMKDSTLRTQIAGWPRRGEAYKPLPEFVRWRKSIKGEAAKKLAKEILSDRRPDVDYAGVLADVLEELVSITPENCEEKSEQLTTLLRPYVPR